MNACNRPSCTGTVGETGFCDTCFRRPLQILEPQFAREEPTAPPLDPSATATATQGGGNWVSGDLLSLPVFALRDPASLVLSNPEVPEWERSCSRCGAEVGRSYAGQPDHTDGYCERCSTRFSFSIKLRKGDLSAARYEMLGPLARGGFGWVYLARARHLDDIYVVLK